MGFGPFSTESRSKSASQSNTGPVTAGQGPAQSTQQSGRSKSVSQGSINLEKGANIAGLTLGNIGRGANITFQAPAAAPFDTESLDRAAEALDRLTEFQADHTASALQATGNIGAAPALADPGGGPDWFLKVIAAAAVAALGLVALAIVKSGRR